MAASVPFDVEFGGELSFQQDWLTFVMHEESVNVDAYNVDSVFVYGTLKRGQCRQTAWPAEPVSVTDAWVRGMLLGRDDYPAMIPGDRRVRGELWRFEPFQIQRVLQVLDAVEETNGNLPTDLYHRHVVQVWIDPSGDSSHAFAYFYNLDPARAGFLAVPEIAGMQSWPGG